MAQIIPLNAPLEILLKHFNDSSPGHSHRASILQEIARRKLPISFGGCAEPFPHRSAVTHEPFYVITRRTIVITREGHQAKMLLTSIKRLSLCESSDGKSYVNID